MGNRTITVSAIHQWMYIKTFKLATIFLAFQGMNHLVYEIVNVKQLQFYTWVIDLYRKVVSDVVAECSDSTVVVGTTPFAVKVRKTINQHFGSRIFTIL